MTYHRSYVIFTYTISLIIQNSFNYVLYKVCWGKNGSGQERIIQFSTELVEIFDSWQHIWRRHLVAPHTLVSNVALKWQVACDSVKYQNSVFRRVIRKCELSRGYISQQPITFDLFLCVICAVCILLSKYLFYVR